MGTQKVRDLLPLKRILSGDGHLKKATISSIGGQRKNLLLQTLQQDLSLAIAPLYPAG